MRRAGGPVDPVGSSAIASWSVEAEQDVEEDPAEPEPVSHFAFHVTLLNSPEISPPDSRAARIRRAKRGARRRALARRAGSVSQSCSRCRWIVAVSHAV